MVPGVCTVHRLVLTPTVTTLEPHAALCPTIKFLCFRSAIGSERRRHCENQKQANSVGWHLAISNKFFSATCAPDLGDIATCFLKLKCFDPIPECTLQLHHHDMSQLPPNGVIVTHIIVPDRNTFFERKKNVAMCTISGANYCERNLLLSASKGRCCKKKNDVRYGRGK